MSAIRTIASALIGFAFLLVCFAVALWDTVVRGSSAGEQMGDL